MVVSAAIWTCQCNMRNIEKTCQARDCKTELTQVGSINLSLEQEQQDEFVPFVGPWKMDSVLWLAAALFWALVLAQPARQWLFWAWCPCHQKQGECIDCFESWIKPLCIVFSIQYFNFTFNLLGKFLWNHNFVRHRLLIFLMGFAFCNSMASGSF